jgi:hypothetical protein
VRVVRKLRSAAKGQVDVSAKFCDVKSRHTLGGLVRRQNGPPRREFVISLRDMQRGESVSSTGDKLSASTIFFTH